MRLVRQDLRCALWPLVLPTALVWVAAAGCAVKRCAPDRPYVDQELHARVQNGLGPLHCGPCAIPDSIDLSDGIAEDEAVAVALWNNSAFNATLAQVGIARGDLIQAGLLRNPQFQLLLPTGTKQLEWALFLPIDAILLRRRRLEMTQREVFRVAEQLVQSGVDLARDVRVAHADLALAHDRLALARETVDMRQGIADLTQKRLDAGDISELEATTAKIALKQAEVDAAALVHLMDQAESRLKQLMGIGTMTVSLTPNPPEPRGLILWDVESLVDEAASSRPDLRAASFAVAASQHRAQLARKQWLRFDAVADANSGGAGPSNFGPGTRLDIPLFDRNQGGVHSADWTVYQATQNYHTVHDQVVADVQIAYSQYRQAHENLGQLRDNVLASLDEAVELAEKSFSGGGASYFIVLQTTTQYLDARGREIQLIADSRRAGANLDRSVGRNLTWQLPHELETIEAAPPRLETIPVRELRTQKTYEPKVLVASTKSNTRAHGPDVQRKVGPTMRRIASRLD